MAAPDWTALSFLAVVDLPLLANAGRGFAAPALATKRYGDDLSRVRAVIEAEHILPSLEALIRDANDQGATTVDALQSFDYSERLSELSLLYRDYNGLDRFFDEIVRWARVEAVSLAVFVVSFTAFVLRVALEFYKFDQILRLPLLVIGAISLVASLVASAFEVHGRNQLSELVRKYG